MLASMQRRRTGKLHMPQQGWSRQAGRRLGGQAGKWASSPAGHWNALQFSPPPAQTYGNVLQDREQREQATGILRKDRFVGSLPCTRQ